MGTAHTTTKEMERHMVRANRAQRRRAASKKKGGAQKVHTGYGKLLKAVQDENLFNESLFKQEDE